MRAAGNLGDHSGARIKAGHFASSPSASAPHRAPHPTAPHPTAPHIAPHSYFKAACDAGQSPSEFVEGLKKKGIRVAGIGHRIKSKDNRDKRVELLQQYARKVGRGEGKG